jgi:radical SAM superfamily enzyme YgiQ (UPF0313 family)
MYESWYREHYHEMSNAGRWFDGNGINILPSKEWERRLYRVLIVRLSTARDTADSFTHQLLYQIAVSCEGVFADCAWLPPPEDGSLFDRDNIPWMTGVVTKRPAAHFDCIAISNSIVQELINLPTLLAKSDIPTGKRERMNRSEIPFVILGGANALFTSVVLGSDPVVDAIFTGENEALIKNIFIAGQKGKYDGKDKQAFLEKLADIPGIIEPDCPKATGKPSFPLSAERQLHHAPVFSGEGKIGAGVLQISEGCPCFCTFCAESWSRKPYREVEAAACVESALTMKASMGVERIDLYSFNFNMHSGLKNILWELGGLFSTISCKSQRMDGIADDPELMPILHAINKSSMTVGIEGISRRLRARLQKSLDETTLHAGLRRLLQSPLRELKIFFLATGEEEAPDIDEFRNLLVTISETMERVGRYPRIIISMTPLVRFPFTPLERDTAPDGPMIREIILQCERLVRAKRFEFRSAASMNEYLFSQIFVRADDPRIWPALCDTITDTGFVYYRDIPDSFMAALYTRLLRDNLTREMLLQATGSFGRLPVRLAVDDAYIGKIKQSSDAFHDMGHCLGSKGAAGRCLGCGACRDEQQRSWMIADRPRHPLTGQQLKVRLQESNKTVLVPITFRINATQRGVSRQLIAAEIARVFMAVDPFFVRHYRGFEGSLIVDRCESDWIHGDDVLTLRFQENAEVKLKELCSGNQLVADIKEALSERGEVLHIAMDVPAALLLTLRITAPWKCDPEVYFKEHALKHTALRAGDGWMKYQFTKDALKKRLLRSMKTRRDEMQSIVEIVPGEKFVYNEFIASVVDLPTERHIVRVFSEAQINGEYEFSLKSSNTLSL